MTQRINYVQQSPELFKKFYEFSEAIKKGSIEQSIQDLVTLRASRGTRTHVRSRFRPVRPADWSHFPQREVSSHARHR